MCGIAGTLRFDSQRIDETELRKMRSFLRERGPDDEGLWIHSALGLAHTRLSIVDLSPLGKQPMEDTAGSCVITFNGEIYNFKDIRKLLEESGVAFRSSSDTEVLLEGYKVWGIDGLLARIDGMFAFVLIDRRNKKAFACRDRFGKKPLYYYQSSKCFKFSSDIRSISSTTEVLTLDEKTIDYYLSELSAPQPRTIWNEIKQIRPAHFAVIDLATGKFNEKRYWQINFNDKLDISIVEAEKLVEKELSAAVIRRIHGDVPIGSFLSAGVDSGLVTAFLAMNSPERIKTFTVSVDYDEYDEGPEARALAARYDTDHTEIKAEATDLVEVVDRLLDYCGEPFADSSLIPSYLISKTIAGKVKVALSGDGGDELFGGYYDYAYAFNADRIFSEIRRECHQWFEISAYSQIRPRIALGIAGENKGIAADYAGFSGAERLYRKMGFSAEEKKELYTAEFADRSNGFTLKYLQQIWDSKNKVSITDNLFEASLETRLVNDYLVKVDRASMINSLEIRSPFLDHRLAEAAARIPAEFHLHGGTTKYLTKKLAERYIDPEIAQRKKKGFGVPLNEWLRKDLYNHVKSVLAEEKLSRIGILRSGIGLRMLDEHRNGSHDHTNKLWVLFCLETWLRDK